MTWSTDKTCALQATLSLSRAYCVTLDDMFVCAGAMQTDSARSLYGITNQSSGKPGHVSNSKALQADRQVDSTTAAALEAVDLMVASANATDSAEQGRSFGSRSSSDMSTTTDYAHTLATADSDINTHRHLPQAADSPNSFHINDRASHISNDRSSSDSATSQQASTPHHDGSGAAGQPSSSLRGVPGGQQGGSRGRRSLKRAFSMMDQDNIEIDADQLNGLDKVTCDAALSNFEHHQPSCKMILTISLSSMYAVYLYTHV